MHAQMWAERLRSSEERAASRTAVAELWPVRARPARAGPAASASPSVVGLAQVEPVERGSHADGFAALCEEMTMVRRSVPGAAW